MKSASIVCLPKPWRRSIVIPMPPAPTTTTTSVFISSVPWIAHSSRASEATKVPATCNIFSSTRRKKRLPAKQANHTAAAPIFRTTNFGSPAIETEMFTETTRLVGPRPFLSGTRNCNAIRRTARHVHRKMLLPSPILLAGELNGHTPAWVLNTAGAGHCGPTTLTLERLIFSVIIYESVSRPIRDHDRNSLSYSKEAACAQTHESLPTGRLRDDLSKSLILNGGQRRDRTADAGLFRTRTNCIYNRLDDTDGTVAQW